MRNGCLYSLLVIGLFLYLVQQFGLGTVLICLFIFGLFL